MDDSRIDQASRYEDSKQVSPAPLQVVPWPGATVPAASGDVPASQYLWIVRRNLWRIAAAVAVCVIASVLFAVRLPREYESTCTIDVDRRSPTGVVGQDA